MATWAMTSAAAATIPAEMKSFTGLKAASASSSSAKPAGFSVSNGSRVSCMLVWSPYNNTKYETLSYVPALKPEQIAKQVDYIIAKGWIPCLEFDNNGSVFREHYRGPGYYDGRYWTLWKLPMFGCNDSGAVLNEINECKKAYPQAFVRLLGFDSKRQVQCSGFLVHKPN